MAKEYISNITIPNGETKYIKDSELTDRVVKLENSSSSTTTDVSTLKTKVSTNTSDISSLNNKVTTNTSDISSLNNKVTTNTSDISSLNNKVTTNTSDIKTTKMNINSLSTSMGLLQQEVPKNIELADFTTYTIAVQSGATIHLDGLVTYNASENLTYFTGHVYFALKATQTGTKGTQYDICTMPTQFTFDGEKYNASYARYSEMAVNTLGSIGWLSFDHETRKMQLQCDTSDTYTIGGNWIMPIEIKLSKV